MKLCSIIPQKVLEPLKEQVAKYFKQKELGKKKMEMFVSKTNVDLTQLKLKTILNVKKRWWNG